VPANIEIKARLVDAALAHVVATRLSGGAAEILQQEDVFFPCQGARLKLRILGPQRGELIRYQRENAAEIRRSQYAIAHTTDPQVLREILANTMGVLDVVRKKRHLYLVGQTRIHIDEVEGLGDFLELEVVLRPGQSDSEGSRIASGVLKEFQIDRSQFVAEAYIDLLGHHKYCLASARRA
jgi:predicted adenylyl cyclase CyaB